MVAWRPRRPVYQPASFWPPTLPTRPYDMKELIQQCRDHEVTPHVAQNLTNRRARSTDGWTRHHGYAASQWTRKLVDEGFDWMKTEGEAGKLRHTGVVSLPSSTRRRFHALTLGTETIGSGGRRSSFRWIRRHRLCRWPCGVDLPPEVFRWRIQTPRLTSRRRSAEIPEGSQLAALTGRRADRGGGAPSPRHAPPTCPGSCSRSRSRLVAVRALRQPTTRHLPISRINQYE